MEDKRMTFYEAAEYLGVHHNTLRRWVAQGKIAIIRISSQTQYITEQALQDFLKSNTGKFEAYSIQIPLTLYKIIKKIKPTGQSTSEFIISILRNYAEKDV